MERANSHFEAVPKYSPVIDGNELTQAKVDLGKMLFFEPRLSSSHLIGCNTCHNVGLGGDEEALSSVEKEGLELFMDRGCTARHSGVNLGGQDYYPFGLVSRPGAEILPEGDKGRFSVTETASDEYVFRAAPLRNIEMTAPYFHSGAVWSLEEAVAVMGTAQLGTELNDDEVQSIVAFLKTLTGEVPEVVYPQLPPSTTQTPKPVDMVP